LREEVGDGGVDGLEDLEEDGDGFGEYLFSEELLLEMKQNYLDRKQKFLRKILKQLRNV
jgi:hypothetical protein